MSAILICLQDDGKGGIEVAVDYEGEFNPHSPAHQQGTLMLQAMDKISEGKAGSGPTLDKFIGKTAGVLGMPMVQELAGTAPH